MRSRFVLLALVLMVTVSACAGMQPRLSTRRLGNAVEIRKSGENILVVSVSDYYHYDFSGPLPYDNESQWFDYRYKSSPDYLHIEHIPVSVAAKQALNGFSGPYHNFLHGCSIRYTVTYRVEGSKRAVRVTLSVKMPDEAACGEWDFQALTPAQKPLAEDVEQRMHAAYSVEANRTPDD
ncbi:hypothetical protein [Desulfocurvibacter africanus]|uniref:hypothetical protein n=1 Tax=Desulfocurvibacter africanus TaxID=873 RepID=UPI0004820E59|nr:hypothetical protein [Desulfocurvibacter africanus]